MAILTWLHGPVLAKNPALADEVIRQILGGTEGTGLENENTRKIDEIVAGVWQLEKPQN
jgi:CobQ-like glutamine amidotransferase family enzyme